METDSDHSKAIVPYNPTFKAVANQDSSLPKGRIWGPHGPNQWGFGRVVKIWGQEDFQRIAKNNIRAVNIPASKVLSLKSLSSIAVPVVNKTDVAIQDFLVNGQYPVLVNPTLGPFPFVSQEVLCIVCFEYNIDIRIFFCNYAFRELIFKEAEIYNNFCKRPFKIYNLNPVDLALLNYVREIDIDMANKFIIEYQEKNHYFEEINKLIYLHQLINSHKGEQFYFSDDLLNYLSPKILENPNSKVLVHIIKKNIT